MAPLIKGIIVDDELSIKKNLKTLIECCCSELEIFVTALSAVEAEQMISYLTSDVIFLDINIPGLVGFDLLDNVYSNKFMVVFVTAYDEYSIIKVRALDYLLIPIIIRELLQAVKRLVNNANYNDRTKPSIHIEKVILSISHRFKVMSANEIYHFEAVTGLSQPIFSEYINSNLIILIILTWWMVTMSDRVKIL